MRNEELEEKLSAIFDEAIASRNASNNVLKLIQELKLWLNQQDIKDMEAKLKAKK